MEFPERDDLEQDDLRGEFEQLADIINSRSVLTQIEMNALGQCLTDLDGHWSHLEGVTKGSLMSFLACSGSNKVASDKVSREILGFLNELLTLFIEAIKPHGHDDKVETLVSSSEEKVIAITKQMKGLKKDLSPMGMFVAINVILNLPVIWMDYCSEMASATGMMNHAMPNDQALYYRDIMARTQERKLIELMQDIDISALTYNSKPFKRAEIWANQANKVYEKLIVSKKCDESKAMQVVVEKFGAPWIVTE